MTFKKELKYSIKHRTYHSLHPHQTTQTGLWDIRNSDGYIQITFLVYIHTRTYIFNSCKVSFSSNIMQFCMQECFFFLYFLVFWMLLILLSICEMQKRSNLLYVEKPFMSYVVRSLCLMLIDPTSLQWPILEISFHKCENNFKNS